MASDPLPTDMRSSRNELSFDAYARAASNVMFLLALVALVAAGVLISLLLSEDDNIYRFLFRSDTRADVFAALVGGSQYLMLAGVFLSTGLGLRLFARAPIAPPARGDNGDGVDVEP
jgi:hypothetical protein